MMSSTSDQIADNLMLSRGNTFYSISSVVKASNGLSYQVGEQLNAGGNAVVHECIETLSGDSYAIKFQVELRDNRRERFEQEVVLLSSLNDPHIISFVTNGSVEGKKHIRDGNSRNRVRHKPLNKLVDIPFVVLLKASENLAEYIKNRSNIPTASYLGQFLGLANALVKVNSVALHRDIKPENVLVVGDVWAISDFGLCDVINGGQDLSRDNERIGPIFWMSPEALNKQLGNSDEITQASDVFQLASVFWYAACGRHPTGIVEERDWKGPLELFPVIKKALLHTHQQRFSTSAEFRSALTEAIGLD